MNAVSNQSIEKLWTADLLQNNSAAIELLEARKKAFAITGKGADLMVPVNTTVILGEGALQPLQPTVISTSSVDTYKTWIGRADELADNHPWPMPLNDWNGKRFSSKTQLTAAEAADIEKAGSIYLFNDSRKVASYARAIEDYNGVFTASLYHIHRLIVQPGASLVLRGGPAILIIHEMELQGSGKFYTYAPCHVTAGKLQKTEQQIFVNN